MAKYIFKNYTLVVEDPQDRMKDLKEGEEITVHMKLGAGDSIEITIPEKKTVDATPKPKPETVYEDKEAHVKGTITVAEHLKVGIDLDIHKALLLGQERLKDSLLTGFDKTYEKAKEKAA